MSKSEPAPAGGRACRYCGGPIPASKSKRAVYCSPECKSAQWYVDNREKKAAYSKKWHEDNREKEAARLKEWRRENPEKRAAQNKRAYSKLSPEALARYSEARKGVRLSDVRRQMLYNAKQRAKKANLPFNITIDDLTIPEKCPVLGIDIVIGSGQPVDGSPSLDKIIPSLGYVKGNVEVISWRANALKRDATVPEMEALYRYYSNKISTDWMKSHD